MSKYACPLVGVITSSVSVLRNEDDPFVQQVQQELAYLGKQLIPISERTREKSAEKDDPVNKQMEAFFGMNPAAPEYDRELTQAEKLRIKGIRYMKMSEQAGGKVSKSAKGSKYSKSAKG